MLTFAYQIEFLGTTKKRAMFIKLTQGYETRVDANVFNELNEVKWHVAIKVPSGKPYACRSIKYSKKVILKEYLHWYVVGKPKKGFVVDHINGDGLDNRRENLRIVSNRANCQNQACHRAGKALGAYFDKSVGKWQAKATIDKRSKTIGWFKTQEEATAAYKVRVGTL